MAKSKSIQETVLETGNNLAQEAGFESAAEFIADTNSKINSADKARSLEAMRAAGDFTSKLTLLTLYQTIDAEYNLGVYDWINKFETTKINAGNSKQYTRDILTGIEDFADAEFNPTTVTNPQCDAYTISLYSANTTSSQDATLSTYAKRIKKPLTIQRNKWMPYFLSGKLQEFINAIIDNVRQTIFLAKYSIFQNLITKVKAGYNSSNQNEGLKKVFDETGRTGTVNITGKVTNILDVFTKVVFPTITDMAFLSKQYNANIHGDVQATSLNSSTKDDILILVNNKTYTKLTSGVLANVFNNKLADISKYINTDNIIPVGKKLTVGNSQTAINETNEDLIAENEVLVINKNLFKTLLFVDETGTQSYITNMSMQVVSHLWIACGIIPWGQGFVVRTDKLTVMPNV